MMTKSALGPQFVGYGLGPRASGLRETHGRARAVDKFRVRGHPRWFIVRY